MKHEKYTPLIQEVQENQLKTKFIKKSVHTLEVQAVILGSTSGDYRKYKQ
jgi:G:T/U-mismatch repair DNA glycosylase